MLNIFQNETVYGGWSKKDCVAFRYAVPQDMYAAIDDEATVTESSQGFGLSVCFTLNHGANRIYKPLSTKSALKAGDKIQKSKCFVTVLSKVGEKDVYRITETQE